MELSYRNDDGTRAPHIVPDVLRQVADVFGQLEIGVFQMAFPTKFVGFDDEPLPADPTGQCVRCQCPTDVELLDEHGICGDCNIVLARDIMRTPPCLRTEADWEAVKELVRMGFVDVYDDGLE